MSIHFIPGIGIDEENEMDQFNSNFCRENKTEKFIIPSLR